jgi:hypothetical protein
MLIDCEQCAMRDTSACDDCVVTCLLGDGPIDLSDSQAEAVANLAEEGLVSGAASGSSRTPGLLVLWPGPVTLPPMVKVYAVALALGVVGLLVMILGGAFADNLGREDADPGRRWGVGGRSVVGALVGLGMGGMSAEFSPLDLSWPIALLIALVAAGLSVFWVRYASRQIGA